MGAFHFLDESGVIRHAGDDGDVFEVFGGRANHGGAADVDVFDEVTEGDAGLCGGLLEGVEVDHDHVDGLNAVRGYGGFVLRVAADVEQASVNEGMQRLYASVEHLGKTGEVADVFHGQAGFAESARGAAGGDEFYAEAGKHFCKLNEPGFVGHAEQRTADGLCRTC